MLQPEVVWFNGRSCLYSLLSVYAVCQWLGV